MGNIKKNKSHCSQKLDYSKQQNIFNIKSKITSKFFLTKKEMSIINNFLKKTDYLKKKEGAHQ